MDIVLDVSENSHGNVYSEVLSKVVAYQYGGLLILPDQNFPQIFRARKSFVDVTSKSSCSALINAVM